MIEVGPFKVSINEPVGEGDYSQIGVYVEGVARAVLWIDDFLGKPQIYLHHDAKHENEPLIFDITR